MIERNKKLIIILSILLVLAHIIPVPFIMIFDRTDILAISMIIATLCLILWMNIRTSLKIKKNYKDKFYKKKKREDDSLYKEETKIYFIFLIIYIVIVLIECFTTF